MMLHFQNKKVVYYCWRFFLFKQLKINSIRTYHTSMFFFCLGCNFVEEIEGRIFGGGFAAAEKQKFKIKKY